MSTATATRPETVTLEVGARIRLIGAPFELAEGAKSALTLPNPKYSENERMGRWNGDTPEFIEAYTEDRHGLQVPRGFGRWILGIAQRRGIEASILDNTRTLAPVSFDFRGTLKPFQERAVSDVLARPCGTLCAPTGSGKTVMALAVIVHRRQPALVVTHTKELLHQWIDRAGTFLGIPAEEVGVIGAGRKDVGERLTVATVQTLYKVAEDVAPRVGFLLVDECHRTPSRTFTEAVSQFDCRFLLGLSATPWRRDKLTRLIYWSLGDVVHEVEAESLRKSGDILRADVVWRETAFTTDLDASEEYSRVLSELTKDPERNRLIASDVAQAVAEDGAGVVLVLSDRKAHVNTLAGLLEARGVKAACLTGDLSPKTRAEALESVTGGSARVLVATGQLIGEGFDLPAMATVFLSTPIRFDGRVLQYIGRVLRPAPGKDRAVVVDYEDAAVGVLKASARARARVYQRMGASDAG